MGITKQGWITRKANGNGDPWNKGLTGVQSCPEHKKEAQRLKRGSLNQNWKGGLPLCKCGKQLSAYTYTRCIDCHKKEVLKAKGEEHFNWIKDRNQVKMSEKHGYDSNYKFWMISVRNRDNWKCKINNCDCSGRLESHHILSWKEYPELRYNINNGITLCQKHHPKGRKSKEMVFELKELIINS